MEIVRVGSLYLNLGEDGSVVSVRLSTAKGRVRCKVPTVAVLEASGVTPTLIKGSRGGDSALLRHVEVSGNVETVEDELVLTIASIKPAPAEEGGAEAGAWVKMNAKVAAVPAPTSAPDASDEPRF